MYETVPKVRFLTCIVIANYVHILMLRRNKIQVCKMLTSLCCAHRYIELHVHKVVNNTSLLIIMSRQSTYTHSENNDAFRLFFFYNSLFLSFKYYSGKTTQV